ATEIDILKWPATNDRHAAVELNFPGQSLQVDFDVASVVIGVDPEVAKLAALAAERDVQVQSQGRSRNRGRLQSGVCFRQMRRFPEREWRIIGDEIVAQAGSFLR